ncbi:MAG: D-aminoacyl-tRNA deacylase [Myxococcota bacterium]
MRAVIQRVREASVTVEGTVVGAIEQGILVLLGVGPEDGEANIGWLTQKIAHLRIFEDDEGKMNQSLLDIGGAVLVVSQFTLYGDVRKGRRPSFARAAPPAVAEPLYEAFCEALAKLGVRQVERGVFGAHMDVRLLNDGPVTLIVDHD